MDMVKGNDRRPELAFSMLKIWKCFKLDKTAEEKTKCYEINLSEFKALNVRTSKKIKRHKKITWNRLENRHMDRHMVFTARRS